MQIRPWGRREFVSGATLAGAAGLLGMRPEPVAAEPPPETTTLRLLKFPGICLAPQYVAEDLLRAEGFTDVQYLEFPEGGVAAYKRLGTGELDMTQAFVAPFILEVDQGTPMVLLAGVHVGCFELFGTERVRTIRDLKGKTVGTPRIGDAPYVFLATMLAYVGLDHRKDVNFLEGPADESIALLGQGKIDAYLGFPPVPQELRARKIGHLVVSSAVDRGQARGEGDPQSGWRMRPRARPSSPSHRGQGLHAEL